ncbi:MAG: hypothetical protein JNK04_03025 [Myxococcales bacterium]|nr:hypothetical protein [Myxococcales bacterium]
MLSREIMGYAALWVLWGNTLLVAIAAAKQAFALLARANRLRARRVVGRVVAKEDGSPIAELCVDQIGRQGSGTTPSVVWHDKTYRGRILGGTIEVDGRPARLAPAETAVVWVDPPKMQEAALCPSASAFADTYEAARKVKGASRTVVVPVSAGEIVSVPGELRGEGADLEIVPTAEPTLLAIDPLRFAAEKSRIVLAYFVPGVVLGAAICTIVALHQPVFDSLVSKIGGLLGFIYFLLVLPAGTAVRDWMREPHERIVRGKWVAPASSAAEAKTSS